MAPDMYIAVFRDPGVRSLLTSNLQLGTWHIHETSLLRLILACKLMQTRNYMTYVACYRVNISKPYQGLVEFDSITENTRISHVMLAYREVLT